MLDNEVPISRRAWFQVLATAVVMLTGDVLFWTHTAGVSLAIFSLLLLLVVVTRSGNAARPSLTITLGIALATLCIALVIDVSPLAVILSMVGLVTLAITRRQGWVTRPLLWLWRWLDFICSSIACPIRDYAAWMRRVLRLRSGSTSRIVLNWLVPIALAAVFIWLFVLANPVIDKWFAQLGSWLRNAERWFEHIRSPRVMLWVITGLIAWGLLRARVRARRTKSATQPVEAAGQNKAESLLLNTGVVVRSLLLFNAIFAVQTGLDIAYLFGGATLPEDLTYAQYAHRGAYPLVATALLAAGFILVTFRQGGAAEKSSLARRLVYLWIAQNVALTATALWRLHLYIEVFTLSRWRVAAAVWLLLVIIGLVLILVRIVSRRSNQWLIGANALSLIAVLYGLAWVDIDAAIAEYNVRNCREVGGTGVPIDVEYLQDLGPEALPAVDWLAQQTADDQLRGELDYIQYQLTNDLAVDMAAWQGWTLRRSRLADAYLNQGAVARLAGGVSAAPRGDGLATHDAQQAAPGTTSPARLNANSGPPHTARH